LESSELELIVSHPVRGTVRDKLLVELTEADVEIGFGLVDDAKAYTASGQPELTARALQNAEAVLADIERRLHEMGESASAPFQQLIAELREQIAGVNRYAPEEEP
jgi:hypothetical protein